MVRSLWLILGKIVAVAGKLLLCDRCPCGSGSGLGSGFGSGGGAGGGGIVDNRPDPGPVNSSCCRPVLMPGVIFLTVSGATCTCMNGTWRLVYGGTLGGFDTWFGLFFTCAGNQSRWRVFCDPSRGLLFLLFECFGTVTGQTSFSTFNWTCSPFETTGVEFGSTDFGPTDCCPVNSTFSWSTSP